MTDKHCHSMGRGRCNTPCCPVHFTAAIPAPEAARKMINIGIERYAATEEEFVSAAEDTNHSMLAAKEPEMFDAPYIEASREQGKLARDFIRILEHYDVHLSRRKD